jgi:hypothetical protein
MSNSYSGFEAEPYRQSLLVGRKFTAYNKAMRVKQVSQKRNKPLFPLVIAGSPRTGRIRSSLPTSRRLTNTRQPSRPACDPSVFCAISPPAQRVPRKFIHGTQRPLFSRVLSYEELNDAQLVPPT